MQRFGRLQQTASTRSLSFEEPLAFVELLQGFYHLVHGAAENRVESLPVHQSEHGGSRFLCSDLLIASDGNQVTCRAGLFATAPLVRS
jgi:hypothetical protein